MSDMTTIEQDEQDRTLRERQDAPTPRTDAAYDAASKSNHPVEEIRNRMVVLERDFFAASSDRDHYKIKAKCYGDMVHGCSPALARAGFPVDAGQSGGAVKGVADAVEALASDLAAARADLATVRAQLDAVTRERELVITDRKRVEAELRDAMQPHFRDSSIATLRTALHIQDAVVQDYQRQLAASEAARVAAEQDAGRLREALDRIVGMCGDVDRCPSCGRPSGIPALVSCAKQALAAGRTDAQPAPQPEAPQ